MLRERSAAGALLSNKAELTDCEDNNSFALAKRFLKICLIAAILLSHLQGFKQRKFAMFTAQYLLSDSDLEAVYKHVHHAKALEFLERARLALLEKIGLPSTTLISRGLFAVVYRIEVVYKREVFAGQICVTCENGRIEGKSFYLTQRLLNERQKECVSAEVEGKLMDGVSKRAVEPPSDFRQAFLGFFGKA